MRLNKNDKFTYDGKEYKIKELLGEGGQGEVYLVNDGSKDYAFKYYLEIPSNDFIYNLKNNIDKGSPSNAFLWPKKYIEFDDSSCGYIMDLRPKNFISFVSFLNGYTKFKNQQTLIRWCLELCLAFKKLHEMGYSYQDLNDGSFFLDPETGDILICDNDNVTADKKNLGVLGKMRYMAPEIVVGMDSEGNSQMPDTHSDRFSLAVILFLTMCLGNPFEGERLKKYDIVDEHSEKEMFGTKPLFIMHKTDKSNRPIRGYHTAVIKRWPYLPIYIKEAFHRTFVDGLIDRENERTTEIEWVRLLNKYRDELLTCVCGNQFIYGFEEAKLNLNCPYCNKNTKTFCYIQIGKRRVALEPGKELYKSHLDKYSSEYNTRVGEVIANKNNPSLWGIRFNLTDNILIKDINGNVKEVNGNGVVPIVNNLKIKFSDECIAEIHVNK